MAKAAPVRRVKRRRCLRTARMRMTHFPPLRAEPRVLDPARRRQGEAGLGLRSHRGRAPVRIGLQGAKNRSRAADVQLRVDGEVRDSASRSSTPPMRTSRRSARSSATAPGFQLAPGLAGKRVDVALPKSAAGALTRARTQQHRDDDAVRQCRAGDAGQRIAGRALLDQSGALGEEVAGSSPPGWSPVRRSSGWTRLETPSRISTFRPMPAVAEPWESTPSRTQQAKNTVLRDARTAVMSCRRRASPARPKCCAATAAWCSGAGGNRRRRRTTARRALRQRSSSELKPMAIAHGASVSAGSGVLELRFTRT